VVGKRSDFIEEAKAHSLHQARSGWVQEHRECGTLYDISCIFVVLRMILQNRWYFYVRGLIIMKINIFKRKLELNKSISSVWEEIRNLTGYSDSKVSNIHKENEDTWYFTFYFEKGKFSRIMSATLNGKVSSKDDSLTTIEIKSGSYFVAAFTIAECILLIFVFNFVKEIVLNMAIKVILVICIFFSFIFAHNRESKLNIDEFIKKLHLDEDISNN
jgi:hypothetical protein